MDKVLYVDDEVDNLLLFKMNFRSNYNVVTMAFPQECINLIETEDIKVVITDYKMPIINGMQLINKIKAVKPEVVCIILSGYVESEVVTDKSKVFSYIMKPYKRGEVLETLERAFSYYFSSLSEG